MHIDLLRAKEQIRGTNPHEIIAYIQEFPYSDYKVHSVPELGQFYLDAKVDVIKDRLREGVLWERHLQTLIRNFNLEKSIVLDIGAHIGTHTLAMAHAVGPDGLVFAFEPQPKIFRELFFNISLNNIQNVKFFWAGVGDRDGSIELSPLSFENEGETVLEGGTGKWVDIVMIDSLNLDNVSLIKIDVEGMEEAVIEGARRTILRNRPIILIEIGAQFDREAKIKGKTAELNLRLEAWMQKIAQKLAKLGYIIEQIHHHDFLAFPFTVEDPDKYFS